MGPALLSAVGQPLSSQLTRALLAAKWGNVPAPHCSHGNTPGAGSRAAFVPSSGAAPHLLCHGHGRLALAHPVQLLPSSFGLREQWPRKVLWGLFFSVLLLADVICYLQRRSCFWLFHWLAAGKSSCQQVLQIESRVCELSNTDWMSCFFHIPLSLVDVLAVKQRGTLFIYCWGLRTHTHLPDYLNNNLPSLLLNCILDSY